MRVIDETGCASVKMCPIGHQEGGSKHLPTHIRRRRGVRSGRGLWRGDLVMVLTSAVPAREDAHPPFPAWAKPFLVNITLCCKTVKQTSSALCHSTWDIWTHHRAPTLQAYKTKRNDNEVKGSRPDPSLPGPLWHQWRELWGRHQPGVPQESQWYRRKGGARETAVSWPGWVGFCIKDHKS